MNPPRILDWLLRRSLPGPVGNALSGDLAEEYRSEVRRGRSRLSADLWYLRQFVGSIRHIVSLRREDRRTRLSSRKDNRAGLIDVLVQDVQYALKGLVARPVFTAVALTTLTLGIGANAAMFSVVNGVVLRPLPYEEPDRLVRVWPDQLFPFDLKGALAFQTQARAYEDVSAFARSLFTLDGEGEPEIIRGARVLANHFDMLGVSPAFGRGFLPEEGVEGGARVVILSDALWRRRWGADPALLGRTIVMGGIPHSVVGVMGPGHQSLESDWLVWAPIRVGPASLGSGSGMAVNGRLAPGVAVPDAQAESRRLYTEYQTGQGVTVTEDEVAGLRVIRLHDWIVGDAGRRLMVLLGAVAFVLLIASVNVANLLLALGGSRRRELAVRQAMGASRSRIAGQLLTEAMVLGLLGGLLGLGVAYAAVGFGLSYLPADIPRLQEVGLDSGVLGFTLVASIISAALFGVAPALRATDTNVAVTLRDGSGGSRGSKQTRLNYGLVSTEIALAVVLVAGAALMLRSTWELNNVDPGFNPDGVLTLRVSPPAAYQEEADVLTFHNRITAAIEAVPGVQSVGAIQFLPMRPGGWWSRFEVPERPWGDQEAPFLAMRVVTPGYFSTMEIEMKNGRGLGPEDGVGDVPVLIVNQALASEAWPGQDPVGRTLLVGASEQRLFRVVGVVGDVRQSDLQTPTNAEAYLPLAQQGWRSLFFTVRLDGDPAAAAGAVRAAVWSVDDRAPISSVSPLAMVVGETTAGTRFFTALLVTFGVLALVLGCVGVYGVMSYVVSQQSREIGIRMAMGAASERVLTSTVARGFVPIALGVVLGLIGAIASGRLLQSVLFGVRPGDPLTLAVVATVLGGAGLLALYVPARRASRVDPMTILRQE